MNRKTLTTAGVTILIVAALIPLSLARRQAPELEAPKPVPKAPSVVGKSPMAIPAWVVASPVVAPPPAPVEKVQAAMNDVRLRSTYQNYRTAVATSNRAIQDALKPQLLQSRAAAVRLAEAELATARTPRDREVADLMIQSLKE